jgi:hypothetical protein
MPSDGDCTKGVRCSDDTTPKCSDGSNWVLVNGVPICSDGSNACDDGTVNVNACTKCLHCLNLDIPIHINTDVLSLAKSGSIDLKFGVQVIYFPTQSNMAQNTTILKNITYNTLYTYTSNSAACVSTQANCQKTLSVRINKDSDLAAFDGDIFDYICKHNGILRFVVWMSTSSSTVTEANKVVTVTIPNNVTGSTWSEALKDNTNLLGTNGIATLTTPVSTLKVSSEGNSDVTKCCTLHVTNPLTINIAEPNCFNLSILYKFAFISTSGYTASIPISWNVTVNVYIGASLTVALSKTSKISLISNQDIFSTTPLCTTQLYGCFVATAEQKASMESVGYIRVVVTINDVGSRDSKLSDLVVGYTKTNRLNTETIYSPSSDTHKTFILEAIRVGYSDIDFTGNKAVSVTNITALNYSDAEGMVKSTNGMNSFHIVGDTCATLPARKCIYVKGATATTHCKHTANSNYTDLRTLAKIWFLSKKPDEGSNLALLEEVRDVVPRSNPNQDIKYSMELWDVPYHNLNDYKSTGAMFKIKTYEYEFCSMDLREALLDSSVDYVFFTISIYSQYMYNNYNTAFYNVGDANEKSLTISDFMHKETKTGLKEVGLHRIFARDNANMNSVVGEEYYIYNTKKALRNVSLCYLTKDNTNVDYDQNHKDCDDNVWYMYNDYTINTVSHYIWCASDGCCAGDYRQFYSKKAVYLYGVSKDTFIKKINATGEWVLPYIEIYFFKSCVAVIKYKCSEGTCGDNRHYYIIRKDTDYDGCAPKLVEVK